MAAEEFLDTNQLPSYYLDQVAEFIITNAGEYQGGIQTIQGDPFTGEDVMSTCAYVHLCVLIFVGDS